MLSSDKGMRISTSAPSHDQIVRGFEHVLYEIWMFVNVPRIQASDDVASNACTEAYLLHARVLRDFFQKQYRLPKHDDILCSDYGFPSDELGVPSSIETRFDKSLAHLTYARLESDAIEAKQWIDGEFRPPILNRCHAYLVHVLANFDGQIADRHLEEAKQLRDQIENEIASASLSGVSQN